MIRLYTLSTLLYVAGEPEPVVLHFFSINRERFNAADEELVSNIAGFDGEEREQLLTVASEFFLGDEVAQLVAFLRNESPWEVEDNSLVRAATLGELVPRPVNLPLSPYQPGNPDELRVPFSQRPLDDDHRLYDLTNDAGYSDLLVRAYYVARGFRVRHGVGTQRKR